MKPVKYLLAATVLLCNVSAFAQSYSLKLSGGIQSLSSSSSAEVQKNIQDKAGWNGRYYWIARFAGSVAVLQKKQWEQEGLQLLSPLGNNSWLVSSAKVPGTQWSLQHRIIQAGLPDQSLKLSKQLRVANAANWNKDAAGRVQLLVALHPGVEMEAAKASLRQQYTVSGTLFEGNRIVQVNALPEQLKSIAALPFVAYVQPERKEDKILNEKARFMGGAFLANAPLALGGHNLKGDGIVVGVGDNADPTLHPDFGNRIINHTPGIVDNHGAHVAGTIAGSGLLQSDRRGFAPLAKVISQFFSNIWLNAATYVQQYGMVLTNNSYGAVGSECDYNGTYDLYSQILDQQAASFPQLLHVFAAGNSGDDQCAPLPQRYNTILGGYQVAKNVITVGRTDYDQMPSGSSSTGPVSDGRLKPEITALGIVESCNGSGDGYWGAYGTSLSAPNITGSLALLYERYKQLHSGQNPQGALMKAVLLNGARDIFTPGPDYRTGYGYMSLRNSLRILDAKKHLSGSMVHGGSKDSVITVAAGSAALKVMLYWHDVAANPLAAKTLVNDLDLEVITPGGLTIYPKKLNASQVESPATEGPDHLNNSEQVVIPTPVPGNYTIRIKGYEVLGSASQAYAVAFDELPAGIAITVPVENDSWSISSPDEWAITGVVIAWEDEGTVANSTYTLEYSLDNGGSWNLITNTLKDSTRCFGWRPPAGTATNTARVRITKNSTAFSSTSPVFSILGRPSVSLAAAAQQCEGYIAVNWTAVSGADDYEVIISRNGEMVAAGLVPAASPLTYNIGGLSKDSTYWVAVRARKGGRPGRYVQAQARIPNSGNCSGTVSDGDLKLDSIVSPIYGRQLTSKTLTAAEQLNVRIKNLDDAPSTGIFAIKYSINGGAEIIDSVNTSIAAKGTYTHSFSGLNFSVPGVYAIRAVVKKSPAAPIADNVAANDSFMLVVKNLANDPVNITPPNVWTDNFDAAPVFAQQRNRFGLEGLDRWDYSNSDKYARIRSFVNDGWAASGQRSLTMDVSKAPPYVVNPAHYLSGTFNLAGYTAAAHEVRLDFNFKHHGPAQAPASQNKVWARGTDTDSWVEVYDLGLNQTAVPGVWKNSGSIELSDKLMAAGQNFSTATQIRFGQFGYYAAGDNTHYAGYSFDDMQLKIAINDLQMLAIDTPALYSCGLNTTVPVRIVLRNSMPNSVSNVPVQYSVNGGAPVMEIISTIPANSYYLYEFANKANLSAVGTYNIAATVNMSGDNVGENNAASAVVINQPVISSFPYYQNFESGAGGFYTSGLNSSWQLGQPASLKIKQAASGLNAWKTRLIGNYNDNEFSYLNTPCFNLQGMTKPTLSFSMAYDIEDCTPYNAICDAAWVEYSTDGIAWYKLGAAGQGSNWYDNSNYNVWLKRRTAHWHSASIPLPTDVANLRLRFVFNSDEATGYEGIAIDDIHIYDEQMPIYTGVSSNAITQAVSGSGEINFTDGGKIMATVLPNGNDLGSTEVKAWMYNGAVRNNGSYYYGNRNLTIKPANTLNGTTKVRFYFTDAEVDSMRLATGCASCTPPADYTQLGVLQYTDINRNQEDGDLTNNSTGTYTYHSAANIVFKPYSLGYYAEFDVNGFSEFWLSNAGNGPVLPMQWISFTANKQANNSVLLQWKTANETFADHYEVQVAKGRADLAANTFTTLAKIAAQNTASASYTFPDNSTGRSGDYYFRIKQVDSNGKTSLSATRLLKFGRRNDEVSVYPNPAKDVAIVSVQTLLQQPTQLKLMNIAGQTLYTQTIAGTGQNMQVSLPLHKICPSKGVYTIGVNNGNGWYYAKVIKE